MRRRAVCVAVLMALAMVGASATVGADALSSVEQATIVQAEGGNSCVGESATLAWTRPAVEGLSGYRIQHWSYSPYPSVFSTDVALEQTSLPFSFRFGYNTFLVYAITTDGVASSPFAATTIAGNQAPHTMTWHEEGATVGDKTATTSFRWPGPVTLATMGGVLPVTLRVTASPGGASVDVDAGDFDSNTATFDGLENGTAYTFTAVASNACGSSAPDWSPLFTPGIAPSWVRAAPPLSAASTGQYIANFAADGDPRPTYHLVDAPSWLAVSPNGLVRGRPPEGVSSFSYSVVASNGVGVAHPGFPPTDVVAGPFSVSVTARSR